MRFIDTFTMHKAEPNKSLFTYLNERRLELGRCIKDRKKVYIDTKFWLILRDNKMHRSENYEVTKLFDLLYEGVESGKLICPISESIFVEILNQRDPMTLNCTTELVDVLSHGVSVLSYEERAKMELFYLIHNYQSGEERCYSPQIFVWTKIAYVLGFIFPGNTPLSPEDELAMQKAFLDQMWEVSLSDMVDTIGINGLLKRPKRPDISNVLNAGKLSRMHENKSFEEMFLSELAGILDMFKPDFEKMLAYVYENQTGLPPSKAELESIDGLRMFANFIYHAFSLNKISKELPALSIPATLHAAIRWDKNRKYKSTDLYDIFHAIGALPYFDLFLTDHSLCHLLTRNDLSLDELYGCRVVSKPSQAIAEIEKALS